MSVDAPTSPQVPFAEPTPLGLLCLAIGCAALLPIAFGVSLTPAALKTAAWFCLLFGAGGQFLAGILSLANKNLLGGTLFTAFSFNWAMNWWTLTELAEGRVPDGSVGLAVDGCFLIIFAVLTYAFAFHSGLLAIFLLDIDLLYAFRMIRAVAHLPSMATPIALCTVALAGLSLWIAFGLLVNPSAGKPVFPLGGPWLRAPLA